MKTGMSLEKKTRRPLTSACFGGEPATVGWAGVAAPVAGVGGGAFVGGTTLGAL